ncbi:MAG: T9SS type A sorting domain-containing protein [Crocinitomicaceae bacterium]|nr:T9SS type A sorting domain-containing protein [Crocinitomicaceae bacterium]
MKKLFIGLSLLSGLYAGAQELLPKCSSHTVLQKWLEDNPDKAEQFRRSRQELEDFTQNYVQSNDSRSRGVVYTIPVVFHVIHDYGESNISDAQIYDQMEILNRDYRLLNQDASAVVAEFQGMPADIEVEFVLATKKPNGQCFNGITRTASTATSGNENQQVSAVQNAHGNFPGDEYLNVFVVTEASGAAGYTYPPSFWGASMSAGIYIQHSYVGSIGTGGASTSRALTHEVGHWFNLSHTWGDTNNPGVSCGDDQVSDTPQTKGWTTCNLTGTTCDGQKDNVENYMEYSYCSKMFTPGQKTRMRAALASSTAGRNNLWTAQNLAATGADGTNSFCKADFEVDRNYTCVGGSIQFTDLSYNTTTNWTWNTTGGTADNANGQNPIVTYNTPGLHPVTLTSGDAGSSDSEFKNNFIHVFPTTAGSFPHVEDFEGYGSLPTSGLVSGFDGHPYGWEIHNGVGSSGTKAIKFNAFACPFGQLEREFISYPIDLTSATAGDIEFTFKMVYKLTDNMVGAEKLFVYFSDDCGETWTLGRQWFSTQINQGTSNFAYNPTTAGEYVMQSYTIPNNFKVSNFMYKMVWKNTGGNNIFIDDINIAYLGTAGIEENVLSGLSVYPNPFGDNITIKAQSEMNEAEIKIFDARGKLVKSLKKDIVDNLTINTSEFSQGLYIMEIRNGGFSKSFRIVK